jgi:hypothetical protein
MLLLMEGRGGKACEPSDKATAPSLPETSFGLSPLHYTILRTVPCLLLIRLEQVNPVNKNLAQDTAWRRTGFTENCVLFIIFL